MAVSGQMYTAYSNFAVVLWYGVWRCCHVCRLNGFRVITFVLVDTFF